VLHVALDATILDSESRRRGAVPD